MVKYTLHCDQAHEFEVWFDSEAGYTRQMEEKQVQCPYCGDTSLKRGVGSPAIIGRFSRQAAKDEQQAINDGVTQLRQLRSFIESNFENHGSNFVQAARGLHDAETKAAENYDMSKQEDRKKPISEVMVSTGTHSDGEQQSLGIYGQASEEDYKQLCDEGIAIQRIPWIRREDS